MSEKRRNTYVDFLRGIAMLIVILGHTLDGSAADARDHILYNIIWSLQIPLFILISGYVTRYSCSPESVSGMIRLFGKRTLSYLLPWLVFTVILNGVFLGKQNLTPGTLFRNMDSGYWFLITLWTISIVFIAVRFIADKLCRKKRSLPLYVLFFVLIGMALLAGMGSLIGFDYFCLKLTLYYMPFYYLGYLFGYYHDRIRSRFSVGLPIITALGVLIWVVSIIKLDLFNLSDARIMDILLRAGVSLCGCIGVCGLFTAFDGKTRAYRFISWIGVHSLEIFLLHYYYLNLILLTAKPDLMSLKGIAVVTVNYLMTVLLSVLTAKLLSGNRYLNLVLFGKPIKKR